MLELTPDHPLVFAAIVLGAVAQDDLTCITVGLFVSAGDLPMWPASSACFLGTLLGDLGWFFGARWTGRLVSQALPKRWLRRSERTDDARDLLDRWGGYAIVVCRFLPGLRTPVHVLSGLFYESAARASVYLAFAAAVYTPLLVGGSAAIGDQLKLESLLGSYGRWGRIAAVAAVLMLYGAACLTRRAVRRSQRA